MSDILVIAEHRQGELRPVSLELVAAAKEAGGSSVTVALIGANAADLAGAVSVEGVDEIVTVATPSANFQPDEWKAAVEALIEARSPSLVLLPHSVDSWGFAPALGATGKYGFTTDVFGIANDGGEWVVTRAMYKEKVNAEIDFPGKSTVVVTVRGGTWKPAEGSSSPAVSSLDASAAANTQHVEFIEPPATGDVDITQAEFMLSIGRGIAEEDNVEQFSELADAVGATLGCSRPIADSGWLPKSRQVGQSGKVVAACKVYVAMGISGSVQHQAGMKHVENIIAVNTDPEASIFSIARYGINADIFDIAEELITHYE